MYTNLRQQLNREAKIRTSDDDATTQENEIYEKKEDGKRYSSEKIQFVNKLNHLIPLRQPKPKMQRKYNMALQHFYQAATQSTTDDDDLKSKLKDLSGSEEDLFTAESTKMEFLDGKSDHNKNTYFTFKKGMSVKRVKPVSICSMKYCAMCFIWLLLFTISTLCITYFIQLAVYKIQPRTTEVHQPVTYERYNEKNNTHNHSMLDGCSDFEIEKVWHRTHDRFQTESAVRLVDVNKDGHDDIIMGFVTSLDGYGSIGDRRDVCMKYYNGRYPCFGGVMATNGVTGEKLWVHYSWHDIYAINCNGDLNNDGVEDCLCAGRGGVFEAVSGRDGQMIWMFLDPKYRDEMMNLYTPQFINDVDSDGVMDVLQIHGGDPRAEAYSKKRLNGRILFISGRTGLVLASRNIPDNTESYFSPVIYTMKNGTNVVVFGNGGETHNGSLFVVQLQELYEGKMNMIRILSDQTKGFMNPPILVDLNKDGVVDLVNAGYSETITAIDGQTLKVIWKYTLADTETYSVPGVAYYNDDEVVDFLVRLNTGPGFPVYYNSKVIILDGRNGKPLVKPYMTSAPAHSSPLSVSMQGKGNDLFLHWSVDCEGHKHQGGAYKFVQGTNVHESSRIDSCVARYGNKSFSKLYVMNRHTGLPGKEVYYSNKYFKIEHGLSSSKSPSKRHIGIPDHGGVQRLLQTGAVLPSLSVTDKRQLSSSFDIVFGMYYIKPPSVRVILPSDMPCIREYRRKAKNGELNNNVDVDLNVELGIFDEGDTAVNYCLGKRMNGTRFDNQETANAKNLNAGKLTLYRFKVTCKCDPGKKCAKVLPQNEQGWGGYMGTLNNGYFNRRLHGRFSPK